MVSSIIQSIVVALSSIPKELVVFFISLVPILELRGGLIAASLLNLEWCIAFPICLLGNALPIPVIILFIDKIFAFLKKTKFHKIADFFEKKASVKSKSIVKYKEWGLFAFVAIPLPGTGGWTGALIAALLRLDIKKSIFIIALGIFVSGILMSIFSYMIPYFCFK
ncbi:MAG: small multi-drug export protein [Clostridia bacterium]|nr:small multi-drug export protein [Clostridia bacterium]